MFGALREGFARLRRNASLVLVVYAVNLGLAALLAVPLAARLERSFENRDAAANSLYGFDAPWHGAFRDGEPGWAKEFDPEIFGAGFAFRNLELLLKGHLPAALFAWTDEGGRDLDPVVLGLGLLYLLGQVFLTGGLIAAFRAERGGLPPRAFLHGAAFYFVRLLRVGLLGLLVAWVVFRLNAPFARWADAMARESVSETTALVWAMGRHLLLLLALLAVSLVSGYAKVILVVEERSSAVLAWVSAVGFCLRRASAVFGHGLLVTALGLLALGAWAALDGGWTTTGYRTQVVSFALMQALVLARIALRLGLLAGQTALYGRSA